MVGAMLGRAEAQVMRLACLYAALDLSPVVAQQHLEAALALWDYCERSVGCIFGAASGDDVADRILAALEREPAGLTRTGIRDLFGRHGNAIRIALALEHLERENQVRRADELTGGRSAERWFACQDEAT